MNTPLRLGTASLRLGRRISSSEVEDEVIGERVEGEVVEGGHVLVAKRLMMATG